MSKCIQDILSNEHKFNELAMIAFKSVDTDDSGQMESSELYRVMAQIAQDMGADEPSQEDVDEVFNALDTDGSGKINFEEFKVLIRDVFSAMLD